MNDATRELGAALGVAVLGSIAASKYSAGLAPAIAHLPAAIQAEATTSLGGALEAAARLPAAAAGQLTSAANHAFVSGIHIAALAGAALAACASLLVMRFLPRDIPQQGAAHGPLEAAEDIAELALAGVPPVFADTGAANSRTSG
jgi:ABC-type transport system involved in cytochrome c biogenesis permease subunit